MSETYKLVFRGEVLDGQHPAVVRKRLAQDPGFGDEQLDKLFSGRPVIVKREADTATAAKFQAVFKKAGARLRVLPADGEGAETTVGQAPADAPPTTRQTAAAEPQSVAEDPAQGSFELLPAGSDLLQPHERSLFEPREVDIGSLALEGARFTMPEPADSAPAGPDVSHLSMAAPGTDLGVAKATPEQRVTAPQFELARAGEDLTPGKAAPRPAIDVAGVTFEVAPAGTDLGQRKPLAAPQPPDTSHLRLE